MGNAVRVKELAQQVSVVASHKAGGKDVLPAGGHSARGVHALAARVVYASGHAHDGAVHEGAGKLVGLVYGSVERDGGDHGVSFCGRWGFGRPRPAA